MRLNKETDDLGIYNAEYVYFNDNTVEDVEGMLVNIYRGGTDESTFGPHFMMSGNTLKNVGKGKRNKNKSSILLHGAQVTSISNNKLIDSREIKVEHTVGEPVTSITDNQFINTPAPNVKELIAAGAHTATLDNNQVIANP